MYERLQEQVDDAAMARGYPTGLAALPDALRDLVELVAVDELPSEVRQ
ncbi:hypothetical protein AB6N24_06255 [Cellulomonas sp. 179-A 4D5 NHS]